MRANKTGKPTSLRKEIFGSMDTRKERKNVDSPASKSNRSSEAAVEIGKIFGPFGADYAAGRTAVSESSAS